MTGLKMCVMMLFHPIVVSEYIKKQRGDAGFQVFCPAAVEASVRAAEKIHIIHGMLYRRRITVGSIFFREAHPVNAMAFLSSAFAFRR